MEIMEIMEGMCIGALNDNKPNIFMTKILGLIKLLVLFKTTTIKT
jgi:hypothetical protein